MSSRGDDCEATRRALITAAATVMMALSASTTSAVECAAAENVRFVRRCGPTNPMQCSDANDGRTPQTAWATLQRAAHHLNRPLGTAGEMIVVGPGVYRECNIDLRPSGSGTARLPKMFLGDRLGECTGDAAGAVVLDARGCGGGDGIADGVGFLVFGASHVVISGFDITNGPDAGIQVRPGPLAGERPTGVIIAHNVLFQNGLPGAGRGNGVDVTDANELLIFNNLIYENAGNGIGVLSSPRTKIINNTVYGQPGFGVVLATKPATLGTDPPPSTGSWLINNIIAANATGERPAFNVSIDRASACDYVGAFNLIGEPGRRYSPETPRDLSDILDDPAFNAPSSSDFRLRSDSPAIDAGSEAAARLQLETASARADGAPDDGAVDLGYHVDSTRVPMFSAIPATTQMLFVRETGSDDNDGRSSATALRTISAAVNRARAVSRVVVGKGVYPETVSLPSLRPAGPIELFADALGTFTGDAPGRVVVDAQHAGDGINVTGTTHCSTVVDGFVVMNGRDNGIQLKNAHRSVVRNNVLHANQRGINVADADDIQIVNNLTYANVGGIQVGGNDVGSPRAVVESNTIYGNSAVGLLIGSGPAASPGARVRYNVIDANGKTGVQLDSNDQAGRSADGACIEYNVVSRRDAVAALYGPIRPEHCGACQEAVPPCTVPICRATAAGCMLAPPLDLKEAPRFVLPVSGSDGCLGGRRFWDDGFWLAPDSRAIDLADEPAAALGLDRRNTERCDVPDTGLLDAGFHALNQCFTDIPPLTGDCNDNACVTVEEMVAGVNIALDRRPLTLCPPFDSNADGRVTVNELVSAVGDLLCCDTKRPD